MEVYNNTSQGSFDFNLDWSTDGGYSYNVWVHDNSIYGKTSNTWESGIILEVDSKNVIIESNTIYRVNWGVILSILGDRGGDTGMNNIVIRNNLVYDIGKSGGDGTNGIAVGTFSRGQDNYIIDSLFVYNNTFVTLTGGAPYRGFRMADLIDVSSSATNIFVKNNIFQRFVLNWAELSYADEIDNISISYNDAYNNGSSDAIEITNGTPTNYTHTNNITTNPTFVAGVTYHLDTGSPCINAGVDVGLPYCGAAPDIGYWESGSCTLGNFRIKRKIKFYGN